jgi:hypothetical protein
VDEEDNLAVVAAEEAIASSAVDDAQVAADAAQEAENAAIMAVAAAHEAERLAAEALEAEASRVQLEAHQAAQAGIDEFDGRLLSLENQLDEALATLATQSEQIATLEAGMMALMTPLPPSDIPKEPEASIPETKETETEPESLSEPGADLPVVVKAERRKHRFL